MKLNDYIALQEKGSDWSYGSGWGDAMVEAIKEEYKNTPREHYLTLAAEKAVESRHL